MFRNDDPTSAAALPTPAAVVNPGFFTDGNPSAGVPATIVQNDWANGITEEIVAVVQASGQTLSKTNNTQLLQAIRTLGRIKATGNVNVYVSPSGSDTVNTGLSPASPFLTMQHAVNFIGSTYDFVGLYAPTINVANGTYTATCACTNNPLGAAGWTIIGNVSNPDSAFVNVANGNAFVATNAFVSISGFKMATTGVASLTTTQGYGIIAQLAGSVNFFNVDFGTCGTSHLTSGLGSTIFCPYGDGYTISGSAPNHCVSSYGALLSVLGCTVTLTGTPNFSTAFAVGSVGGNVQIYNTTFVGSATGPRYLVQPTGIIQTNGSGASYLPGNSAGTVVTGGYYL